MITGRQDTLVFAGAKISPVPAVMVCEFRGSQSARADTPALLTGRPSHTRPDGIESRRRVISFSI
jgi:hypothetical protein